jgi:hypothetical protein
MRVSPSAHQASTKGDQTPDSMRKAPGPGSLGAFRGPPNAEERGRKCDPSTRSVKRPLRNIAHAATRGCPAFARWGSRRLCGSLFASPALSIDSSARCPIPPPLGRVAASGRELFLDCAGGPGLPRWPALLVKWRSQPMTPLTRAAGTSLELGTLPGAPNIGKNPKHRRSDWTATP